MLRSVHRFLAAQKAPSILFFALLLVGVVGAFDVLTGYELSFSIFYAIPVAVAAWYTGKRLGLVVALISAVSWFSADVATGHTYSHPAIPYWNASVRLGYFLIIAYLLRRVRLSLERQEQLAQQDGLTGLLNARAFKSGSRAVFDLAARHRRPLTLAYLDLDGFKGVNDSLGHDAGDRVLREVGAVLAATLRGSDFGGRLGGDEFAVLLPETDLAGARVFFGKLRSALLELVQRNRWPVGFSIGVAVFSEPTADVEDAIRCADRLMYEVKGAGKNDLRFEEFPGRLREA